ncbi:hypothetical protein THARTR1_06059 [Trichoderma harzianum]|uniref:Zn(2)-C6 fungal-type domain-containing protein n=1 Tax=Trichoderma harzianum TaxID=5544 RepID=A0A2K0U6F6_TRIHA|nr:hypothetical protein THARTR1_06059 [Trichoderma harzianum]
MLANISHKPSSSRSPAVQKSKSGPTSKSMDQHPRGAHSSRDVRRTRVSKACERCRLKKIKCDGDLPCQKCKNNGHVCTPGIRKRTIHVEYKQVPKSYVEFLETTHLALIGSVHKLYTMIQKNQSWDLGDPELNDQGELVIHDVAKKLGCIGSNGEIELPIQYELPATASGMARIAAHPNRLQYRDEEEDEHDDYKEADSPMDDLTSDDSPSSELMQSLEAEVDHRKEAFAGYDPSMTQSPQSLYSLDDSEHSHSGSDGSVSQIGSGSDEMTAFLQQYGRTPDMGMFNWDLGDSDYNGLKNNLSTIPEFGLAQNIEGQMTLPEYNDHSAWLSLTLSGWKEENQVSIES